MKNNYMSQIKKIDFSKVVESGDEPGFYESIATKIVNYVTINKLVSLQELVKNVGGSDRRVVRLVNEMVKSDILKFKNHKFGLSQKGSSYEYTRGKVNCPNCDSKIVKIHDDMQKIYDFTKKIINERPSPTFIFDQRPVNAETTVRRVGYLIWRGDAHGKKIAFIGDDDLTSISLAFTKTAEEIVVFDIDERVLETISKFSNKYKLNIKVVKQDLIKSISKKYSNYFDVFITDPTPTPKPLVLFTNRGLEMLKPGAEKVGYISLYPSHMERTIDYQVMLGKMNLLITDQIPNFNEYDFLEFTYTADDSRLLDKYAIDNESKISFTESLMRIETTNSSKLFPINVKAEDLIGRATKRIINNPDLDPVLGGNNPPKFLKDAASELKESFHSNE